MQAIRPHYTLLIPRNLLTSRAANQIRGSTRLERVLPRCKCATSRNPRCISPHTPSLGLSLNAGNARMLAILRLGAVLENRR